MRSDLMAKDYLERARLRLDSAKMAMERGYYPDVVRFSQEVVEISGKAILRLVAIEYPLEHDVSEAFNASINRFPRWIKKPLQRLSRSSKSLAEVRGLALYGNEKGAIPPSVLFDEKKAEEALSEAQHAYGLAVRFFDWFLKRGK